jgi:hypothetical protein
MPIRANVRLRRWLLARFFLGLWITAAAGGQQAQQ